MTTKLSQQDIDTFHLKCREAFPSLDWHFNGSVEALNAIAEATIPDTSIRISIVFDFPSDSAWSTATLLFGVVSGVRLHTSSWEQGRSLEFAIASLREFLKGYAAALTTAIGGES